MIGCLDLIRGFPDHSRAYIGLLVLDKNRRGQGVGGKCWQLAQDVIRAWNGVTHVRLGISVGNVLAEKFWLAMGFLPTGESSVSRDNGIEQLCSIYEVSLAAPATSIYIRDESRLSDTEFEAGQLEHIATMRPKWFCSMMRIANFFDLHENSQSKIIASQIR
jgi:hypothetical protein